MEEVAGGGGGGRLHRPSRALRAPRVTRMYAYVITAHRARHHHFPSPPRTTGTRALLRRRRSLARSRARRRRRWGWGWRSVTPRVTRVTHVTRVTRAREHAIAAHRARHHRSSSPHAPTRARCDGSGARSLDSARGVWRLRWRRWRAVEVAGGYIARHARYARRASRACMRTSSPRIARVITIFRPPAHDRHARAAAAAALARSLARAEAEAVGLGVAFSYTARHGAARASRTSRASRARASTPSPRIARVITVPLPPTRPHARAATAAALARSIARAVCGGCGGGGGGRWRWRAVTSPVTRVTRAARHAHVCVRHHRASRASSPFSVPPRTTGTRALLRRRRSLARSRARRRRRWGWGWRSVTPRVTRVTRAHVYVTTAHRARHHRPPSPMSPMRTRGSGGGAVSFARLLARAEAEADGHPHVVRVSRVTRARAHIILITALVCATPPLKCAPFAAVLSSLLSSLSSSLSSSLRARINLKSGVFWVLWCTGKTAWRHDVT